MENVVKIVKKYSVYKTSYMYTDNTMTKKINITAWQYQQFKDSPVWELKKVITTFFKKSHKTIEVYQRIS